MTERRSIQFWMLFTVLGLAQLPMRSARAAEPPKAPSSTPAKVESSTPQAPLPTPTATTGADECFPACRSGYLCHQGQCLSACNPPCSAGLECRPDSTCAPAPASSPAAASEAAASRDTEEPHPSNDTDKPYFHDGFYLQLGLGLAGVAGKFDDFSDGNDPIKFVGGSGAFHIAVGGTVARGLVVGGELHSISPYKLRVREDGDVHSAGHADVALLGAFVDWYVKPDAGFHVQGALGPSFATLKGNGRYFADDDFSGSGLGLMLGVGYEFFVSKQWSLGGLAQVQAGGVTLKGKDTKEYFSFGYAAPSLLFNGTFH